MKIIIDRFEGDYAVCETDTGSFADVPRAVMPQGAAEGDVISITIDRSETDKRKQNINSLMDSLFED